MDPVRYARAKELFEQVIRLEPAERAAFLERARADEPDLGREVADLLRHHEAAPGFLTRPPGAERPSERPMPKLSIPGYGIVRELGRGGMGVVYLAEQERPRREVALKVLRLDRLLPADVRRFEREGEILGRLHHPGIAHVHGVGLVATEQGELPWIAMEFVRGESFRTYVEERALDLRDLVGLFAELCVAVHHAHEKGIVHRDLKPSNVLVDEHGQVRVLDFGVARLLGDDAEQRTLTGQVIGTLAYASPEQAAGRVHEVDARTDVYSLGVMLHELLAGELPYEIDESRIVETIQTICDEEPRRLRRARSDAPADLETVLLKALDKDPARRYANAGELADDLRRFLADRPVHARRPTALYQVRKFVRRNRALTVSTSAVIAALLTTIAVLLVSARKQQEEYEHARSMLDLFASEVFNLVPVLGFGENYRGSLEALDTRLAGELARAPGDRALRGYRARSLYELGALDQARADFVAAQGRFEQARALRGGLIAQDPADRDSRTHLSQIYARLGDVARDRGDGDGQLEWYRRALELDQDLVREHPDDGELVEDLGWSLERMTDLAIKRGDWAEAERYSSWRLADAIRLVEQEPENWKFLYNAAQAHALAGHLASKRAPDELKVHDRELLRLTHALCELQPGRAVFQFLRAGVNFEAARTARAAGRHDEAVALAEVALGLGMQLFASDPHSFSYADRIRCSASLLADLQVAANECERARGTLAQMRICARLAGEESPISIYLLAMAEWHECWLDQDQGRVLAARWRAWPHVSERVRPLLERRDVSSEMIDAVRVFLKSSEEELGPEPPELARRALEAEGATKPRR